MFVTWVLAFPSLKNSHIRKAHAVLFITVIGFLFLRLYSPLPQDWLRSIRCTYPVIR